ncbi:MAG: MFS transporter [Betaproteobacteria bacterium]|nr:MFS transporter [Betaproteobacteria bacterium]
MRFSANAGEASVNDEEVAEARRQCASGIPDAIVYNCGMPAIRLPPFMVPLIFISVTGHMALSGGRLTGSLFILNNGYPEALVGLFMALFSVVPVLTSLHIGRWVDRAGAERAMRVGVALVLLGAWLPVAYLSLSTLLVMGVLIGFGFSIIAMAAQHTVGHLVPDATPAQRMTNFGWYALGHSTSSVAGPFIAGLLIDAVSIRAAFAAMAVSACVAAFLVATRLRGLPRAPTGAAAAMTPDPALAGTFGPDEVAEPGRRPPHVLDLLATPEMRRIYWVNCLTATSWDLFIVMLPVLGHRLGYSASVIGTVFSFFAIGTFAARAVMPWLSRRFTEWQILRAAMIVITLVFVALPWMSLAPLLMSAGIIFGAAVGLSQPNMLSLLHTAAPAGRGGEAVGLRSMLSNGCSVVVPLAFGAALSTVSISTLLFGGAVLFGTGVYPAHHGAKARR